MVITSLFMVPVYAATDGGLSNLDSTEFTLNMFELSKGKQNWSDKADFENAERGLIALPDRENILSADGKLVWEFKDYQSIKEQPSPDTVHPVLWRQTRLNSSTGLFKVTDNIYQVRGFDLANMSIIESDTGIIIVDPLTSVESAKAAISLYYKERGERDVHAVIYTHSHMDHFGGIKGVVSQEDVASGDVKIFAPRNFHHEAISENLFAGNVMLRRTIWYSGIPLPRTSLGIVDAGLGPGVANGKRSYISPTTIIEAQVETHIIDGFTIEFYLANNTEAPSELIMYYPQEKVLNVAEVAIHSVHNLLTPRGAKVRDTLEWVSLLSAMLKEYAPKSEIMIGQHHWPTWGKDEIASHLQNQRDFYKFVHDQTLHMANQGFTKEEISEKLTLPASLASQWTLQDYYGTLASGGKAVFQFYLGWYDGNPTNLQKLSDVKSAPFYMKYMGGSGNIIANARDDFEKGNYQWVVQVLQHVIFAEPDNQVAKSLAADAFTQLGYQQISATWRNLYLSAAHELRNGIMQIPISATGGAFNNELSIDLLLKYAGISLDSQVVKGIDFTASVSLDDLDENYTITVQNGVLSHTVELAPEADFYLSTGNDTFAQLLNHQITLDDALASQNTSMQGDSSGFERILEALVVFSPNFNLVTP